MLRPLNMESIVTFFAAASFVVIIFTDYLYYRIPNAVILFLMILTAVRLYLTSSPLPERIVSAIIVMGFLSLVNYYYEKRRNKQAIGFGDIKLLGILFLLYPLATSFAGLWLSALIALAGSLLLRLLIGRFRSDPRIPFGSFICATFLLIELCNLQEPIEHFFLLYKGL